MVKSIEKKFVCSSATTFTTKKLGFCDEYLVTKVKVAAKEGVP